ncbi:uncharacterized protein PAC_07445 [Phialocephala subalpina]|uniref:Uncharacterized protein n=1 Tax=Phialocephala subalpina TaxID=576137 RepID=A0A1L7WXR3_9HELO|nr:uncharacterized protein PAC_07445 [Phialocephala subalpina]
MQNYSNESFSNAHGAFEPLSPIWDNRFSTNESFDDNEFEQELTNFFDEKKAYDNTQHSSGEGNLDPPFRSLSSKRRDIAGAGQQEQSSSSTPTFMTPQSRSNEPSSATESPNSTPTSTSASNKRANDSDGSQQDAAEAKDKEVKELHGLLEECKSKVESLNKRLKFSHVEVHFDIQNTDSTIPTQTDNTQSDHNRTIGDGSQSRDQEMQAHQEQHQAPRLSLSSTLSNEESQAPTIFSQNELPEDGQSVVSQTTYRSSRGSYPPGGKSCDTCVKLLAGGFFSTWKNHFWPTHYPQEGWYCLFCKVTPAISAKNRTLLWECTRCSETFTDQMSAVTHFTVECWERNGLFKKLKPFNDHLTRFHPAFPQAFALSLGSGQSQCPLCEGTFQARNAAHHRCPKIESWTYNMSTPFPATCDWHSDQTFDTYEKMNTHIEDDHFKKSKQPAKSRRRNDNRDGSSQGGAESNFDMNSQRNRGSQSGRRGQRRGRGGGRGRSFPHPQVAGNQGMVLGNASGFAPFTAESESAASGSIGNALLSPRHLSQRHHAHLGALGDLTTDLQGLAQEGQLPTTNHHVDTSQNIRLSTGKEPPRVHSEVVVTDGHPSFIRRNVTPPQPEQNSG